MKVTRRDFLKLVGTSALLASLDWSSLVKKAFAEVQSGSISLVWFEAQDCAGDTTALIQATDPDVLQVLGGTTHITSPGSVILPYHETVMPEWGPSAIAHLLLALGGVYDPYVLILEGSIAPDEALTGIRGSDLFCYVGDVETVHQALEALVAVVEGKMPADKVLPVIDVVKAISPRKAEMLLERAKEKVDEIERATKECLRGLKGEDPISCARWFACLMKKAVAVVALGNCAAYGGVRANSVATSFGGANKDLLEKYKATGYTPYEQWSKEGWSYSPTGSLGFFPDPIRGYTGFAKLLYSKGGWYREVAEPYVRFIEGKCVPQKPGQPDCKPAIAVPGCPANGNAQLRTLANVILWARGVLPLPELDEYWRPKFIFGQTVHEQCPRAAWYAAGVMRKEPGEPTGACLFSVGCKGPVANCPYNKVGWVNGVGGPTRTGAVCIGCTMPGFMDAYEPFYKPLPAPVSPNTNSLVAMVAGAAVVGAAAAYGMKKLVEKESKAKGK
ncbi:NiFe hydrogenase [Pyrolobus fumarii 1A]|uniref:NiFe hydrogenase n=1 Tax=Pyrolobus fumarii (strain DSM 11204 / 1A) TaxID=694429 RepID=G0EE37_PYRF1|nr:hydrogenase [Pyrolobus fumarii]AEM37953.1 NiFe hydrogenase [Pyrolobus fumarii 1A]